MDLEKSKHYKSNSQIVQIIVIFDLEAIDICAQKIEIIERYYNIDQFTVISLKRTVSYCGWDMK